MSGSLTFPRPSRAASSPSSPFDAVIIGAGAAGLLCAALAGQRGRRVLLLDHWPKVAEKIRISGGGRCNFTNLHTRAENFVSGNPHFCKSALSRYGPQDIIALLRKHRIGFHEKHKGQLFCDDSAEQLITALREECAAGEVTHWQPCAVEAVESAAPGFRVRTAKGWVSTRALVVATGGLSIPQIGASPLGYRLAEQFGLPIVPPRPALVPLAFDPALWAPFADLSGVSLEVDIQTEYAQGTVSFREDLLLTHRGLSGPAILQASTYWQPGKALLINLMGEVTQAQWIQSKQGNRRTLAGELGQYLPQRLAQALCAQTGDADRRMADFSDKALRSLWQQWHAWAVHPSGTLGWRKAEVTAGGVDTEALSSATLMARNVPGLHFIGEVVDVTGWLGGYNFQWAWSSAAACAQAL
ncbi:MAG: aminoacetone oxidase family FAD-binding enzyme [Thiomonas sp.]|uniref:NAD(P)/FAD-dependent oxidoreductase n=1 Tax=Thiomonas sp. TaxID=2047785 RepID=UPI002A36099A|nr:aminoacetone oxidase family FAD-binding enzyme [Thiomonas sp.]MDY0330057.1 aminoacetone oxidase family FAD-binding enzyme [Thiomonas sp.]